MAEIKVYSIREVSAILKVGKRTIYTYIKEGKIKAVKVGKEWRVSEENLRDFLSCTADTASK